LVISMALVASPASWKAVLIAMVTSFILS
jgi:hypothetical protein